MRSMTRIAPIMILAALAACGGGSHDAKPTTPPANQAAAPPAADDNERDDDKAQGADAERVDEPAPAERPVDLAELERRLTAAQANIPAECAGYLRTLMQYVACDKVPADVRPQILSGVDTAVESWHMLNDPNVPPDARQAALDGCSQGEAALRQGAAAIGCPLP